MSDALPYILLGLSVLINVLQFVAPRTQTKVDDVALEVAEKAQDYLKPKA